MTLITSESDFRILSVKTENDKTLFTQTWYETWIEEEYAQVPDNIIEKYSKYDLFSDDFLLLKNAKQPIGTLRIVNQNYVTGLPVLNDFEISKRFNKNEKLCEATLLTVKKAERQTYSLPALLLLIQLWRYVRFNNINGIVIAADIRLWFFLKRNLALCFSQIGPKKMYEGSITVPGYLNVKEQKQQAMKLPSKNILLKALQEI